MPQPLLSRYPKLRPWLLLGTMLLLFAAVIVHAIVRDHENTRRRSEERLHAQLHVLDENIKAQLQAANNALLSVVHDLPIWRRENVKDGLERRLAALSSILPGVRTISIIDRHGVATASNRPELVGRNFADRDYFRTARNSGNPGTLFVSPPFHSFSGIFVVNLTRVLVDENGRFDGLIIASLDPSYFNTLLRSVLFAPDMWASLAHGSGKVFLVMPEYPGMSGLDLSLPGTFFSQHMASGHNENIYLGQIFAARDERMMALRTINPPDLHMDTPLVVAITQTKTALYADWRRTTTQLAGLYIGLALLLMAGLALAQRRERAGQIKAQENTDRLQLATRAADLGIWEYNFKTGLVHWDDASYVIYDQTNTQTPLDYNGWRQCVLPADRAAAESALQEAINTRSSFNMSFHVRLSNGGKRLIRSVGDLIYDEAGEPVKMIGIHEDLTRSEQAQFALREAEERFRAAFEDAAVGMTLVSPTGELMRANRALCEIVGYSAEELQTIRFQDITHPDDQLRDQQLRKELVAQTRHTYQLEKRYIRKQGDIVWVQINVSAVREPESPHVLYYIAQVQDITARHEMTSRISRERDLFAAGPVVVCIWNRLDPWRIDYVSPNAMQVIGYSSNELMATDFHFTDLLHPEDAGGAIKALADFIQSNESIFEFSYRLRRRDGSYRWFYDFSMAERDRNGTLLTLRGYMLDQTGMRSAEEALQQTSAVLANVLDAATETAIIASDANGLITIFNKGAERMLGYRAEEMVNLQTPATFHLTHEIEARAAALSIEMGYPVSGFETFACRARRFGSDQHDWTYVRKDGSQLTVSLIVTARIGPHGETSGYLGVARDVTEARAHEARLLEAKQQAEAANLAKSRFLANMSHEIRTPMNAILGMLQLLQYTDLTQTQQDYANKTSSAAQSLLGILNDILDFSKIEADKIVLDVHAFAPEHLLRELSVILGSTAAAKDIEVLFAIDPKLPPLLVGDALRLQQVLINLAGNAIKFTSVGEVVVALHVRSRTDNTVQLEFSVRDTGIGIPADQIQAIFEGFTQAEASTTRRFGGSGLGLAISQRLVHLMGGTLTVDSQPGIGSNFRFALPLEVATQDQPAAQVPASALHILLVDDNATARSSIAAQIESLGWQCTAVSSGEAALATLRESVAFDAIMLDWQITPQDGWWLTRRIHALPGAAELPVIATTTAHGHQAMLEQRQAESDRFASYLVKPMTAGMLAAVIHQALHPLQPTLPAVVTGPRHRLQGMRLLVVEDNPLNQKVIMGLLGAEGAICELAENGRSGIDLALADAHHLDAVLMDIQMPDMDGYTATRVIREHHDSATLPILAITANVMASDKEACLAAGMNGHINKPIDLEVMVSTLLPYRRADTLIDRNEALQRLGNNQTLYARMAEAFCIDAPALMQQLRQALTHADLLTAKRNLHSLKGIASAVGAKRLAASAASNEAALNDSATLSDPAYQTLQYLLDETCVLLRHEAASVPVQPATASADTAALPEALTALEKLLQGRNMRAADEFAVLEQRYSTLLGERLSPLADAINRLDFKQALSACQALRSELSA